MMAISCVKILPFMDYDFWVALMFHLLYVLLWISISCILFVKMLSSDAYVCFNGFGEMKVERKSLFGVSVKTSGVGYAFDVGWWHACVFTLLISFWRTTIMFNFYIVDYEVFYLLPVYQCFGTTCFIRYINYWNLQFLNICNRKLRFISP